MLRGNFCDMKETPVPFTLFSNLLLFRSLSRNISMEMRQQDAREVIKRKVPMGRREEEEDEEEEIKIDVGQRRIVQPRRRLGERLGLAGRSDFQICAKLTLSVPF